MDKTGFRVVLEIGWCEPAVNVVELGDWRAFGHWRRVVLPVEPYQA